MRWLLSAVFVLWAYPALAQTTDSFTYADNANIEATSGGIWISVVGSVDITSNEAVGPDADHAIYSDAVVNFPDDQYSQWVVKGFGSGGYVGLVLRSSNDTEANADFVQLLCTATACDLTDYTDASPTVIATGISVSLSVNDVLKAGVQGTTVQLFKNGSQFGSNYTTGRTTGQPGIALFGGASADDWQGDSFTLVGGGGASPRGTLVGVLP